MSRVARCEMDAHRGEFCRASPRFAYTKLPQRVPQTCPIVHYNRWILDYQGGCDDVATKFND